MELLDTPSVDTASFESGVQEQLAKAYSAVTERPQDPEAHGELGRTLHAYELRDAAEVAYRNAVALAPRDIDWTYLLAVVLQEKGEVAGAREAFERTLELDADDLPARVRLGQTLSDANQLPEARLQLSSALSQAPNTALAHFFLGQVELAEQNFTAAAERLERALELQPDANRIHHALARAYRGLGDLEGTARSLELAGESEVRLEDPRFLVMKQREVSAAGFVRRAARAQVAGALEAAVAEYRKAIAASPQNAEAHAGLGATLAELGRAEEAQELMRKAANLGGDNAWLRYNLAGAHRLAGEFDTAVDEYRKALELDPKHVESRIGLSDVLTQLGQPEPAIRTLIEALELGEKQTQVHLRLAAIYDRLGRADEARSARRAALESDPTPAERSQVFQQEAELARSRGDVNGALEALEEAVAADPSDVGVVFSLANMLGAARRFEEAAAAYEQVVSARPGRPEAWLGLATALALDGRPDDAAERLEQGIEKLPNSPDLSLALAQMLLSHPDPARRNPQRVLQLLETLPQGPQVFEMQAMAHVATGNFTAAIEKQSRLVEALRSAAPQLVPAAQERLEQLKNRVGSPAP